MSLWNGIWSSEGNIKAAVKSSCQKQSPKAVAKSSRQKQLPKAVAKSSHQKQSPKAVGKAKITFSEIEGGI